MLSKTSASKISASQRGFTLIEMLIALAIGATVSVMSYQSLDSAIRADKKISKVTEQVDEIDRAWQNISSDLLFAVERKWKDSGGESKSAMIGVFGDRLSQSDVLIASEGDYLLQFIRGNRSNLLNQQRSNLFLVGYRLTQDADTDAKSLWRDSWSPVDGSGDPVMRQRRILDGIKEMSFRYLPVSFESIENSTWLTGWPAGSKLTQSLPAAVEVSIETFSMGKIVRHFALSVAGK
jgi:general secretion pathway protein J